jgi:hypothetical protein
MMMLPPSCGEMAPRARLLLAQAKMRLATERLHAPEQLLHTTLADLNWQIISTADFNRDGNADILWRNQATGENAIWQMNSTGYQTGYFLTTVADLNWRLLDTGDFNGDGTADLLWRNQATGENAIWQMNGFSTKRPP